MQQALIVAMMPEPRNCEECAANCPLFKKSGCAYDAARQLNEAADATEALGVDLPGVEESLAKLTAMAKGCRAEIIAAVREDNKMAALTQRVLDRLPGAVLLQAGLAKATAELGEKVAQKTVAKVAVQVQRPAEAGLNGDAEPEVPAAPVVLVQPGAPKFGRGDPSIYVDPSHEALESELSVMPGIQCISMVPKIRVAGAEARIETGLKPKFAQAGVEFVAAVPKRHKENRDLCRIAVWYRTPLKPGTDEEMTAKEVSDALAAVGRPPAVAVVHESPPSDAERERRYVGNPAAKVTELSAPARAMATARAE